jgi:hypothetical protein
MRKVFLLICCAVAMFPVIGCSEGSQQGTVVTTDESEILEYERIQNEAGEADDEVSEPE